MHALLALVALTAATKDMVRRVAKQHLREVAACFEADGNLDARVDVDFTFDNRGKVTSATAGGEGSAALQGCIATVFRRMKFEAGHGVVRVQYPVHIIFVRN